MYTYHCGNVSSQRMCLFLHVLHPLRDFVWLRLEGPPPGPAIEADRRQWMLSRSRRWKKLGDLVITRWMGCVEVCRRLVVGWLFKDVEAGWGGVNVGCRRRPLLATGL